MPKVNKYADFSDKTQKFMNAVEKFITKKYGKIEAHWAGQLMLLASNYDIFIQAQSEVKEKGLLVTNRFGALEKNPLLRVITDANIQCFKIIQEFGLSPMSNGKVKEKENDDTAEIISGLING